MLTVSSLDPIAEAERRCWSRRFWRSSAFSLCSRRSASTVLPIKSNLVIPAASASASAPSSAEFLRLRLLLLELASKSSGSIRERRLANSSKALAKSLRRCFSLCLFRSDFLEVFSPSSPVGGSSSMLPRSLILSGTANKSVLSAATALLVGCGELVLPDLRRGRILDDAAQNSTRQATCKQDHTLKYPTLSMKAALAMVRTKGEQHCSSWKRLTSTCQGTITACLLYL